MSESNKSYRIRTNVGDNAEEYLTVSTDLVQDYNAFDVLSVTIKSSDTYKLHNANYGVIVGRVLANNGFGVPNAKISIFIEADANDDAESRILYPFASSLSKDRYGIRYNLLPDNKIDDCHQVVGTFPNKRYLLDNDDLIEVYDKYYKYTTRTNNSGDYLVCGVPTGSHTLHVDLDLSDCGILSQKPRDFVYKGYTIEQFENPNMFKSGTEYDSLSQIITQDQIVDVKPFWGNSSLGEELGITRADVKIPFKFEPTCVFMGSVISDNASDGISKKCIPSENMGNMEELTTGEGRIEMIRKTPGGNVEEFQVKGTQLINSNGVWCYQIPMNLDYLTTDEYGNLVPTDDPDKGIPTRARVRFRISMQDNEENKDNFHRAKVLVPHNPQLKIENNRVELEDYDYEFGSYTKEESFRDLFWNNVYSVKSFIPRFQKRKATGWKENKFTGIKMCNFYGQNNPIPYNNIRIKLPLMFMILCALIKAFIFIISLYNRTIRGLFNGFLTIVNSRLMGAVGLRVKILKFASRFRYMVLKDGLCPDLDNWYFAPLGNFEPTPNNDDCSQQKYKYQCITTGKHEIVDAASATSAMDFSNKCTCDDADPDDGDGDEWTINLLKLSLMHSLSEGNADVGADGSIPPPGAVPIDESNVDETESGTCITVKTDYLIACIEMALAMEYKVIKFDFYNDWLNGVIYFPRWVRYIKYKRKKQKIKGCMDDTNVFSRNRRYTQLCSIGYKDNIIENTKIYTKVINPLNGITSTETQIIKANNRQHKKNGFKQYGIFGVRGGICHEATTLKGQHVYYLKPCERITNNKKANLFATDLILLGSLNDCDENGVPMAFKHLSSTSYLMPTNIALTNMENNGPLYGHDGSTICVGYSNENNMGDVEKGVGMVSSQTLTNEAAFFSGGGFDVASNSQANDEEMDTMPITEAAGISWNYTGPGQGEIVGEKMYYPGGHFLGLSCVNSQSNIKSCINLSRICEVGANMSQRREDVFGYSGNDLSYVYSVPSGFISGDDIVDTDFRSMFATLNSRRLIATKKNPYTGYKYYDFMYSRPINFDGSFYGVISGNSEYNTNENRGSEDESATLSALNITSASTLEDYDPNEYQHTQTKTNEMSNLYYYMFRFGLTDDIDLNSTNGQKLQQQKFLYHPYGPNSTKPYYLPQYENSYYFYFGLRQGSTAIDEFNKQFFAQCETMTLEKEPTVFVKTDFNVCKGSGSIKVSCNNMSTPYESIVLVRDGFYTVEYTDEFRNLTYFTITGLTHGNYRLTIIDENFVMLTRNFVIGEDVVNAETDVIDFTINLVNNEIPNTHDDSSIRFYNGGFVIVNNIDIGGIDLDEFDYVTLTLEDIENNIISTVSVTSFDDDYYLYGEKTDVPYIVKVKYRCDGEEENEFEITSVRFNDNSSVKLKIGEKDGFNFSCINKDNGEMADYMQYMSSNWWWDDEHFDITNNDHWIFRPLFFREETGTTFNSRVFGYNGDKVVWGTPQTRVVFGGGNFDIPLLEYHSACTEDYMSIPAGYFLDDDNSVYYTYGISRFTPDIGDDIFQDDNRGVDDDVTRYSNLQYSAVACNKENASVSGDYFAIYDINNGIQLINNGGGYFKNGYGCVFKPLPYGDLLFMFYNDEDSYSTMVSEIQGSYENIERGIIYPSFIYPVMNRFFNVDVRIFLWGDTVVSKIDSENGSYYDYGNVENGYKVEGKITNGITVKGSDDKHHFDTTSFMTNYNENEFYNEILSEYNDLNGLKYVNPNNRIIDFEKYKENNIQNGAVFHLKYGYPQSEFSDFAREINFSSNDLFAERINIVCEQRDESSYFIKDFFAVNESNDVYDNPMGNGEVIYYLSKLRHIIDFIYDEGYVKNGNSNDYYILCRFYYANDTQPIVNESEDGKYVIVRLYRNGSEIKIKFDYIDGDGILRTYNSGVDLSVISCDFVDEQIDEIISKFGKENEPNLNLPIIGVNHKRIRENPNYGENILKWYNLCKGDAKTRNLINNQYLVVNNDDAVFGVGLRVYRQNNLRVSLFKIYPYLFDVSNYDNTYGDGEKVIWISNQNMSCEAKHSQIELQISGSSNCVVNIAFPRYVSSEIGTNLSIERDIVYDLTFDVKHNNEYDNRCFNIVLNAVGSEDIETCVVTQDGCINPIVTLVIRKRIFPNGNINQYYGEFYEQYNGLIDYWIEWDEETELFGNVQFEIKYNVSGISDDGYGYNSFTETLEKTFDGDYSATQTIKTATIFGGLMRGDFNVNSVDIIDSDLNNKINVHVYVEHVGGG